MKRDKRSNWLFFLLFAAYLVICFGLLAAPDQGAFLLPAMLALVIGAAALMGPGVPGLLILVATLVSLGVWRQWPEGLRPFVAASTVQMWVVWYFLHRKDRRFFIERIEQDRSLDGLERRSAELRREIESFQRRAEEMKGKSGRRQQLAASAKDLGAVLDAREIQSRLLRWAQKTFPDGHALLAGLVESDPIDAWVLQRRQPLLQDDVFAHPAFQAARLEPGTRSLMVAPLKVENKLFGGLRVESSLPKRFGRDDLRVLDALATMASLALDNAVLFHRIVEAAVKDGLTGLLTHKAFEERLNEELLRAGRYRYPVSLLMVDVDFFKKVNDTYGHPAGDEVLRKLSARLAEAARPVDVPSRYGGEEFSLLLVELDGAAAAETAERLRESFARERFAAAGREFSVTLSIGVACYPAEALTPAQLVRAADQRLYQAKSGGRNRVVGGRA